ncbi:MAG: HNH endonuclease, partial [Hyphomicrobiales bacterium]
RDRTCRTPWCDAPIRHHDHIQPREYEGPTTAHNGASLCAACNYAKQGAGWNAKPHQLPGGLHKIEIHTPTGHRYRSTAPPLPKPLPFREVQTSSPVERILIEYLHAA